MWVNATLVLFLTREHDLLSFSFRFRFPFMPMQIVRDNEHRAVFPRPRALQPAHSAFVRSFLPILPNDSSRRDRGKGRAIRRQRAFPRSIEAFPKVANLRHFSRERPLARSHDLSRWETLTSLIPKVTKRVPRRPSSSLGKGSRNNGPCPQWRRRQSTALYRWKMCSHGIRKTHGFL